MKALLRLEDAEPYPSCAVLGDADFARAEMGLSSTW